MSSNIQVASQAIRFDHVSNKDLETDWEACNNDIELCKLIITEFDKRKIDYHGLHL